MSNYCQWDSVCCCENEKRYDALRNGTQQQRTDFYMDWYHPDTTCIYPWKRSTTVIPKDLDLCSMPNGKPDANTKIGIRLYRAPTNDLPCACKEKCEACRTRCKRCGTCE